MALSAAALIVLLPIMLIIVVAIRAESSGPALFRQIRVGRGGARFEILKFRSMRVGSDRYGHRTDANDTRITRVGKVIRRTSLDELPQLWNVLRGDMSIVGPRPDVPAQEAEYTSAQWEARHGVRPGITGLAQVNGRSAMSPEERIALDLSYVRRHGLLVDLKIIIRTAMTLFSRGVN